jgi:chromosome segregation ATPase
MKDGFDRSIAERMPKMQKRRPSRPWNVDPVLMREQTEEGEALQGPAAAEAPVARQPEGPQSPPPARTAVDAVARTVETIEDIHSEFTQILFEKKDIQRRLQEHDRIIEQYERDNLSLRENLAAMERTAGEYQHLKREISFLNEQIEDADHYIRQVMAMLGSTSAGYDSEVAKNRALEERIERMSRDIRERAGLDVKVSILEKDLNFSTARIHELESRLEEETQKRRPLEEEIAELKCALDKVHSSLSHIRLKAKREVYGS